MAEAAKSPTIKVGPIVDKISEKAAKGFEKAAALKKNEKVESFLKGATPKYEKAKSIASERKSIIFTVAGVVLLFLGSNFKNILLCGQVMNYFLFCSLKTSFDELWAAVSSAWEKMQKEEKDKNSPKVALKALGEEKGSEKVSAFALQLFKAAAACHMVMHGGPFARGIIVAYALANGVSQMLGDFLDISGHDDIRAWIDKLILLTLYFFFGGMALILPSLALALNASFVGAQLVKDYGLKYAKLESLVASQGPFLIPGLMALGVFSYLLLGGGDMAWYFKLILLPAYFVEGFLGLL
jgi:hypothetical protein